MGVSVGGVLRQRSAYFRRDIMAREMFDWQPVYMSWKGVAQLVLATGLCGSIGIAYAGPLT